MVTDLLGPSPIESLVRVIQISLAPAFLLTGIATLINVLAMRLARVADQVDALWGMLDGLDPARAARLADRFAYLRRRTLILDVALALGATAGVLVLGAIVTLFVGALRDVTVAAVLFALFGLALLCAMAAILVFLYEILVASHGVRASAARGQGRAQERAQDRAIAPERAASRGGERDV